MFDKSNSPIWMLVLAHIEIYSTCTLTPLAMKCLRKLLTSSWISLCEVLEEVAVGKIHVCITYKTYAVEN